MALAITAPIQLSAAQNSSPIRINSSDGQVTSIVPQVTSSNNAKITTISPAPVVQVNPSTDSDATLLNSPFIDITKQAADTNNLNKQPATQISPIDNTPKQIRSLSQQQQQINSQQSNLSEQQQSIDRQISTLQQKEIEINRKKFQLQQSTGNRLNIQI